MPLGLCTGPVERWCSHLAHTPAQAAYPGSRQFFGSAFAAASGGGLASCGFGSTPTWRRKLRLSLLDLIAASLERRFELWATFPSEPEPSEQAASSD